MPPPIAIGLMAGGGAALAAVGVGLFVTDGRARLKKQRFAGTVLAYAPAASIAPGARLRLMERSRGIVGTRLLATLAISIDRPDLYPIPWWLIIAVTTTLASLAVGIGNFLMGPAAWAALPVAWFLLTRVSFRYFDRRRSAVLYTQMPDALAMIGRSIRSGITVQDALRVVANEGLWPTSKEFQRLHDEIRVGASLGEALIRLAQRSALVEYRFFAVALALQSQSGGSLSETLENLADVVRKRVALRQRAIALSAEARTSMYVLGCLPFATGTALVVVSPDYLTPLIDTSLGRQILFGGLVLLAMGFGSMKLIIKKSLS